jgi:hypothetical protein
MVATIIVIAAISVDIGVVVDLRYITKAAVGSELRRIMGGELINVGMISGRRLGGNLVESTAIAIVFHVPIVVGSRSSGHRSIKTVEAPIEAATVEASIEATATIAPIEATASIAPIKTAAAPIKTTAAEAPVEATAAETASPCIRRRTQQKATDQGDKQLCRFILHFSFPAYLSDRQQITGLRARLSKELYLQALCH